MAQFEALLARRTEEHNRATLRAGTVAAAIYNANPFRDKDAKPVDPVDFVPDYIRRRRDAARPQTIEEQIEVLTAVLGCGPARRVN